MRIIDGDVLFKNLEWLDEYDSYVFHNVKINIDETPTVDAIPIEWLKNKISQYETETLNLRDRSYYKTNLGEVYTHSLTTSEVECLNDLRRKSSYYSTILEEWESENEID